MDQINQVQNGKGNLFSNEMSIYKEGFMLIIGDGSPVMEETIHSTTELVCMSSPGFKIDWIQENKSESDCAESIVNNGNDTVSSAKTTVLISH